MLGRRGALGGVLAGFGAARARGQAAAEVPRVRDATLEGFAAERQATVRAGLPLGPQFGAATKAFSEALGQLDRARYARERVQRLLGGLPPHLYSMRAASPWFLAHRAVVWEAGQRSAWEAAEAALRKEILGQGG